MNENSKNPNMLSDNEVGEVAGGMGGMGGYIGPRRKAGVECPNCGSKETIIMGLNSETRKQGYLCLDCRKSFEM